MHNPKPWLRFIEAGTPNPAPAPTPTPPSASEATPTVQSPAPVDPTQGKTADAKPKFSDLGSAIAAHYEANK